MSSRYKTYAELKFMSAAFAPEGQAEESFFARLIELQIDPDGLWVVSVHPRADAEETATLMDALRQGPGVLTHVKLESGSSMYTGSVSSLAALWMSAADGALDVRPLAEDALGAWWSCLSPEQRHSLPLPAAMSRADVIARLCEGRPLGTQSDITGALRLARAEYVAQTLLLEEAAEERAKAGRQEQQLRRREKQRLRLTEAKEHLLVAAVARALVSRVLADGLQRVRGVLRLSAEAPPTAFDVAAAAVAPPVPGRPSSVRGASKSPAPASPASGKPNRPRSATLDSEPAAVAVTGAAAVATAAAAANNNNSSSSVKARARANTAESLNSND